MPTDRALGDWSRSAMDSLSSIAGILAALGKILAIPAGMFSFFTSFEAARELLHHWFWPGVFHPPHALDVWSLLIGGLCGGLVCLILSWSLRWTLCGALLYCCLVIFAQVANPYSYFPLESLAAPVVGFLSPVAVAFSVSKVFSRRRAV